MSRRAATVGLVISCTAGAGCFDVRMTDPGPPVVDDFEDGDLTPAMRSFANWTCGTYEPRGQLTCQLVDGDASNFGLSTSFSIADAPDGIQRHGSAFVTTDANRPVDLTAWSAIAFDVRVTTNKVVPDPLFHLDLSCSTVPSESGTAVVALSVVQGIAYSNNGWTTVVLALSNFGPPPWQPEHIQGGSIACLRAIDEISFVWDAALPDGESVTGTLSIDEVRLQ